MRKLLILLLLAGCFRAAALPTLVTAPIATAVETVTPNPGLTLYELSRMKIREVEKRLGRKLKFKEKIGLKILRVKLEKERSRIGSAKPSKAGETAFILGLIAVILGALVFVIPFTLLASIPLGILAIVKGNRARRADPTDRQAKAGIALGWVALGIAMLVLIAVIALIAIFSSIY